MAAAALQIRLELAAKTKLDLGEIAAPVTAAVEGAAVPAEGGEGAAAAPAAPAAETKEAPAEKAKK